MEPTSSLVKGGSLKDIQVIKLKRIIKNQEGMGVYTALLFDFLVPFFHFSPSLPFKIFKLHNKILDVCLAKYNYSKVE
jgi:hypothetical protein